MIVVSREESSSYASCDSLVDESFQSHVKDRVSEFMLEKWDM